MKLATVEYQGKARPALIIGDTWLDLCEAAGFQGDLIDFIGNHPSSTDLPRKITSLADAAELLRTGKPQRPLSGARLLAPLPRPRRSIFCIGKNYRDHIAEFRKPENEGAALTKEEVPEAPIVFAKLQTCVIGPDAEIDPQPQATEQLDYEVELAVIIGRPGRAIKKSEAMSHVWGYTILNDVTARDLQKRHRQWLIGKSLDTFCPMGPWIVTADEVNLETAGIRSWVNGELRQNAKLNEMLFDIPTQIESISAGIRLESGDIIATGTPAGVGGGFKPPRFLKPGDTIKMEIDGIGVLTNRVGGK